MFSQGPVLLYTAVHRGRGLGLEQIWMNPEVSGGIGSVAKGILALTRLL